MQCSPNGDYVSILCNVGFRGGIEGVYRGNTGVRGGRCGLGP